MISKWFTSLAILFLLVAPVATYKAPTASIKPLSDGRGYLCTTWSRDEIHGLWGTAAHCVQPADDFERYIDRSPVEIVQVLHASINKILAMPDVEQRLSELATSNAPKSTEEFTQYVKTDIELWREAGKISGTKLN